MAGDNAVLTDRKVIEVSGPDARSFLQRLITNDVDGLEAGQARYAALLTPQGKIVADFLVVASDGRFLLDAPAAVASDLARKLSLYRLRAKVEVVDRSDTYAVLAFASGAPAQDAIVTYADPRNDALWHRAIVRRAQADVSAPADRTAYDANRIQAGVPESGVDYAFGDTFPHEANLDRLSGVDFRKGCYVGQEVVSRVEHRGTARKRIVAFSFEGPAPAPGSDIRIEDTTIGTFGSAIAGRGLGLVRLDRLEEAVAARLEVTAAGIVLRPAVTG